MDVMGGNITINLKELHQNKKEETHAHKKQPEAQ
jgi:hypothetical protein